MRPIRIGHVGLILEILGHAGLPPAASSALVEMLSAAAAEGKGIQALESALDRLAGWLRSGGDAEAIVPAVSQADDGGVDRLFRHLVPDVTGRRSGHEIIHRLRRKWDLDHSLSQILGRVRDQVHALAELRGPAQAVLERLDADLRRARAAIDRRPARAGRRSWVSTASNPSRVELDLGFGRGIGFYTQMIFELVVADARRAGRGLRRRPLRRPGPRAGQRPRRPRRRLCVRAGAARRGLRRSARDRACRSRC